jgi:hypothetical protein
MSIDARIHAKSLLPAVERFFDRASSKILNLNKSWDYVAPGKKAPRNESPTWDDCRATKLVLYLQRENRGGVCRTFFVR